MTLPPPRATTRKRPPCLSGCVASFQGFRLCSILAPTCAQHALQLLVGLLRVAHERCAELGGVTLKPYPHRRKWETRPRTAWSASWAKGGSDRCMWAAGVACRRRSAVRKRQDQAHTRCDAVQPSPRAPAARFACAAPHARVNAPPRPDGAEVRAPQQQGVQLWAALRVVCVQVRGHARPLAASRAAFRCRGGALISQRCAQLRNCLAPQLAGRHTRRAQGALQGTPRGLLHHGARLCGLTAPVNLLLLTGTRCARLQVMDLLGPSLWDTWNQNGQTCVSSAARARRQYVAELTP